MLNTVIIKVVINMSKIFAKRLKEAREKKGWTQEYMAKLLGITNGTLSGYERDYRKPSIEMLIKIAKVLGVDISWLLGIDSIVANTEGRAFSVLRRTHPHIVELIEQAANLPPEQQELIAGHWKWALDVVRKHEEEKRKKERPVTVKEEKEDYRPDLEQLVPRDEPDLGQALVKISSIAYKHKLSKEEFLYLTQRAVDCYGKPEVPEDTWAAHGPKLPGQIKEVKRNAKEKKS